MSPFVNPTLGKSGWSRFENFTSGAAGEGRFGMGGLTGAAEVGARETPLARASRGGQRFDRAGGLASRAPWRRTAQVSPKTTTPPTRAIASAAREAASTSASRAGRELSRRLPAQWKIKTFAPPVLMTAFFMAYFFVLKAPVFPVTIMPLLPADAWIAFAPWTLPLYLSLWIY